VAAREAAEAAAAATVGASEVREGMVAPEAELVVKAVMAAAEADMMVATETVAAREAEKGAGMAAAEKAVATATDC
jgi:hypothetical protein